MVDIFIVLILVFIIGCVVHYIYKKKKAGVKCIGCPCAKTCSGKCRT